MYFCRFCDNNLTLLLEYYYMKLYTVILITYLY